MQRVTERGYTWPARIVLFLLLVAQGVALTGVAYVLFRTAGAP